MLPPSNNTCPWKLHISLMHSSNTISCKLSRDMKPWNYRSLCSITLLLSEINCSSGWRIYKGFLTRKSIPSNVQYVTLHKYFSHPSLVIYFLSTPHIKLKLGLQIGARLLIANHLDQSETRSSSQIIFITLFSCMCTALMCILPASANCAKLVGNNHFAEPNWHVLTFLHPILMCRVTRWAPLGIL
jgi:hypothetical protein